VTWRRIRRALAGVACVATAVCVGGAPAALASAPPVELAAPYEYLGWGQPQAPASVMAASGLHDLTLAFILSHGACNPMWDASRPLIGGSDQAAIESIRAAGGDVVVSFGGWSGKKLGSSCKSAGSLAGAYQKVIDAYSLKAIDIDIEHGEASSAKARKRVIEALALVQRSNPGIEISITFASREGGPEASGRSLIADAAAIGFQPSAWTIMPFDFGRPSTDMGHASIKAAEGLAEDLASAYHLSLSGAYQHAGISSMDGDTDEASETVSLADFQTILAFAQQIHLARLSFWSVNRDRQCGQGGAEECSGIAQQPYAFSSVLAQYHG
jgi:chitinase